MTDIHTSLASARAFGFNALIALAITGALVLLVVSIKYANPPPQAESWYCQTGAGPTIVEGFDVKTDVHPLFSDVWVLTWRRAPGDIVLQSVALQPPFECGRL